MIHRETRNGRALYRVNLRGLFLPGVYASEHAAELAQRFCRCALEALAKRTSNPIEYRELRALLGVQCICCKAVP